jgi:hypothetical protein
MLPFKRIWLIDLAFFDSEIIRQRVLSHLALPAHVWNSSPGVFYAAGGPDQLYAARGHESGNAHQLLANFTAIIFTKSDSPVTNFKV